MQATCIVAISNIHLGFIVRILYHMGRLLLISLYFPMLILSKKWPKYRARLLIYKYHLQCKAYQASDPFFRLAQIKSGSCHFKMLLQSPGKIEDQLIAVGSFENHISTLMPHLVTENTVVIDVGANIGFHTLNILSNHPTVSAHCFEPHPEIFQELNRNVNLNGFTSRVVISPLALSDKSGEVDFFAVPKQEKNRGMSSLEEGATGVGFTKKKVQTCTFDSYWGHHRHKDPRIGLIKIDTQGHEGPVLRGMLGSIREHRPVLFLEFETDLVPDKAALWALYCELETTYGYCFFIINKNGFGLDPLSFSNQQLQNFSVDLLGLPD